ncbi:ACP S-malonyltransferase [Verrucomicrobiales bacterium]|nr:ACP S-malonyltransferase [Verrucomicrobiales bacterium]
MKKSIVLLFAGQGAQEVGMGYSLSEAYPQVKEIIAMADEELGAELSKVMFNGPNDKLTQTSWCQPALYVHGLACWEMLKKNCPSLNPVAAAGLSLGEFTAYSAAGSFSFLDGLKLVAKRGKLMDESCSMTDGSMAAIIGGDEESVRGLAKEYDVDVANLNAPGQIVISGSRDNIFSAVNKVKDFGCRMGKVLDVAGAYHSRLMTGAQAKLAQELESFDITIPNFPVISNVDAKSIVDIDSIRASLERQVTGSVRWNESMEFILDSNPEAIFIEFSPKPVLAGLMNRIRSEVEVLTVSGPESLKEVTIALS